MKRFFGLLRGSGVMVVFAGLLIVGGWRPNHDVAIHPVLAVPAQPTPDDASTPIHRVNAPHNVPGEQAAVFWFGRVTPTGELGGR